MIDTHCHLDMKEFELAMDLNLRSVLVTTEAAIPEMRARGGGALLYLAPLLTTVTGAMRDLEQVAGSTAPEYAGEWTDWWANGTASAPREVAASRFAKRFLAAARSPVWGPVDAASRQRIVNGYQWRHFRLRLLHAWARARSRSGPGGSELASLSADPPMRSSSRRFSGVMARLPSSI